MNNTDIKITIFGEEHDPSKEIELIALKQDDQTYWDDVTPKAQIVKDAPYGLSAIVIFKEWKYWDDPENSYELLHNCHEIHYLHFPGHCAFEGWNKGMNMHYFGEIAKEMHIIKSPKWFDEQEDQVIYQHHMHPPLNEAVHPTWTGPLPDYAAKTNHTPSCTANT